MAKSISHFAGKTVDITIAIDEDPEAVHLSFRPRQYTPRLEMEIAQSTEKGMEAVGFAQAIEKLVVSWDLRLEEGGDIVKLKLDADKPKEGNKPEEGPFLLDVPAEVLLLIIKMIGEASRPDPKAEEQ